MRAEAMALLVATVGLACGVPIHEVTSAQETTLASRPDGFTVLPWPDDKAPGGFMAGLQLISLPLRVCRGIVASAKPGKAPGGNPDFRTPLAAAQHFGSHLNMGGPPEYMAVHTDVDGARYYLFSGGIHWDRHPMFSEVAVLLETGEIRFCHQEADKLPRDAARKPVDPHR